VPAEALASFAGVGYALDLADLSPGSRVLDLGSGSGTDSFAAAHLVGVTGQVTGVDMTDEQRAKADRLRAGAVHIRFVDGRLEDLPFDDASFDVVISNGVVNLCPDKARVFAETARVLAPGGRPNSAAPYPCGSGSATTAPPPSATNGPSPPAAQDGPADATHDVRRAVPRFTSSSPPPTPFPSQAGRPADTLSARGPPAPLGMRDGFQTVYVPGCLFVADKATARTRRLYDRYAARYDRDTGWYERLMLGSARQQVCSQAHGRVLEVAIGTGRNLPFYPAEAALTGIDLSAVMLDAASARAKKLGIDINLCLADAQALPFLDACFDTVVCTLGLSSIPDDNTAVTQMYRVLRPGGRLLLLGHIASRYPPVRLTQFAVQWYSQRITGDRQLRRTLPLVEAAGFRVDHRTLRRAGIIELLTASKPTRPAS
jgi:ubiquinone/menaquinone biosynthesis C-methylase UbiE